MSGLPEYAVHLPWLGAPLLALAILPWMRKWRWAGALGLAIIALGVGAWRGILIPNDVGWLITHAGLSEALVALLMWCILGILLRTHSRPIVQGNAMWVAPIMGAFMGEVPAAALLSAGARDQKAAARLALAAAGGGLCGRLGDPALLLLWGKGLDPWVLGLLGLVCIAIASPESDDLQQEGEVDPIALAACVIAFGFAVTQQYATQGLAIACGLLLFQLRGNVRTADWKPLCWLMGSMTVVLVCVAGGGTTLAGLGLLEAEGMIGERILMPMSGCAALLSALLGGEAASLLTLSILDRSPGLDVQNLRTSVAAGLAVGGLGPLVVSGALRAGFWRWLIQVAVVLGLCFWVLM